MNRASLFLSAVSAEFDHYRDAMRHELTRPNVDVKVQEDFIAAGVPTLVKLDDYIRNCDATVHLVGDMTGETAHAKSVEAILGRYPDLLERFAAIATRLHGLSYTQWEAWLTLYHNKPLIIATPAASAQRGSRFSPSDTESAAQQAHLTALRDSHSHSEISGFKDIYYLIAKVFASGVFEILLRAAPDLGQGLASDYRGKLAAFKAHYLGNAEFPLPFGGRLLDLGRLTEWLDGSDSSSRLLVAGPMGRGKSALLVRFAHEVAGRSQDRCWEVVFVPISIRFGTHAAVIYLQMLTSRLQQIAGGTAGEPGDDRTPAHFESECHVLIERIASSGHRLLIVIDGIDEALGNNFVATWFPSRIGGSVKLLVSARYQREQHDAANWLARLGWSDAEELSLEPLDARGVVDVLESLGASYDPPSAAVATAERLLQLTQGEPFLLTLYTQDLWPHAARSEPVSLAALEVRRPGFAPYFEDWISRQEKVWQEENKGSFDKSGVNACLAVLASARGRLSSSDLSEVVRRAHGIEVELRVSDILEPIRRFIVGTARHGDARSGFVLGHPLLAEFFSSGHYVDISKKTIARTHRAFVDWGLCAIRDISIGALAPEDASPYLIERLGQHMLDAGASIDEQMKLLGKAWCDAHKAFDGNLEGYMSDLRQVAAEIRKQRPPAWRSKLLHCHLMLSSARTAANLPTQLVMAGITHGLIRTEAALRGLESVDDDFRWRGLLRLSSLMPAKKCEVLLEDALLAAGRVLRGEKRAIALASVAAALPVERRPAIWKRVFDEMKLPSSVATFLNTVNGIAPHLDAMRRASLLHWMLENVEQERDWYFLLHLLPHMSLDERESAVESAILHNLTLPNRDAPDIDEDTGSPPGLAGNLLAIVFPFLPTERQRILKDRALTAARAADLELIRPIALANVLSWLQGLERDTVQAETLEAINAQDTMMLKIASAAALARQLPIDERSAILQPALAIACDEIQRQSFSRFGELAPLLDAAGIKDALNAIGTAPYREGKLEALDELAPFLTSEQVAAALKMMEHFGDEALRAACVRVLTESIQRNDSAQAVTTIYSEALPEKLKKAPSLAEVEKLEDRLQEPLSSDSLKLMCTLIDLLPNESRMRIWDKVACESFFVERSIVIAQLGHCAATVLDCDGEAGMRALVDAVNEVGVVFP